MDGPKGQLHRLKRLYPRLTAGAPMCGTEPFSSQTSEQPKFSGPGDEELIWSSTDTTGVENGEVNEQVCHREWEGILADVSPIWGV